MNRSAFLGKSLNNYNRILVTPQSSLDILDFNSSRILHNVKSL
ncbi:unnamed protein product [Tenebrio molitor]|nr:unnamed protein product [Tenebrio molitor]